MSLSLDFSGIIRDDKESESGYRIDEKAKVNLHLSSIICTINFKAVLYKDTAVHNY